jgi:HEAT repeat protein
VPSTAHHRIPIRELGEADSTASWKNYREILSPDEYNEEYLLSLLCDPSLAEAPEPLWWVRLHAWRALAQLHSVAAIEPTLRLAEGDDYQQAFDDFRQLSAEIGEGAIAPLTAILADRARPKVSRILAAQGLGEIALSAIGATRASITETLGAQTRNIQDSAAVNSAAANALLPLWER